LVGRTGGLKKYLYIHYILHCMSVYLFVGKYSRQLGTGMKVVSQF